MSEDNVKLLEQTVQNNVEDVRDLEKRIGHAERDISDLKTNQQVTQQMLSHVTESITDLRSDFRRLDEKLDKDKDEQLAAFKKASWKVVVSVLIGAILLWLGL